LWVLTAWKPCWANWVFTLLRGWMGLMLTAIAFQFFVSALVDMRVIAPVALP